MIDWQRLLSSEVLTNNSIMIREHVTLSQELRGPNRLVNSASRWTWLILSVFALWIYDTCRRFAYLILSVFALRSTILVQALGLP